MNVNKIQNALRSCMEDPQLIKTKIGASYPDLLNRIIVGEINGDSVQKMELLEPMVVKVVKVVVKVLLILMSKKQWVKLVVVQTKLYKAYRIVCQLQMNRWVVARLIQVLIVLIPLLDAFNLKGQYITIVIRLVAEPLPGAPLFRVP